MLRLCMNNNSIYALVISVSILEFVILEPSMVVKRLEYQFAFQEQIISKWKWH